MPLTSAEHLRSLTGFPALLRYLEDELDWPLREYNFDELTFEYSPAELGLKDKQAAQITSIHQLRPVVSGQPWAIFFIDFEKKRLPVVLLRRILAHLVVKKRTAPAKAQSAAWASNDLLFISAFGDSPDQREIAFAHFHQQNDELPTLRVLGWDGSDTPLKLEHLALELKHKLHWPDDPSDITAWRNDWSSVFRHGPRHEIRTANDLAEKLAALARSIRNAAMILLDHESENGPLRLLYKSFQKALIHDLTEADFTDTYAQTITYGLLTAAISRTEMSEGRYGTTLLAENITDMVPLTNPFLREMLQTFLTTGGRKGGINFDELGIQDVVDLLRGEETDLPAILRDFGNKAPGEDPVIHFYEHFLAAYDKKLKVKRGVFYTPKPVVSYIVRSVHELLQTEFGLADGLASTTTWRQMTQRFPDLKIPEGVDPESLFVVILDPATGTATFLVEVIDVIFNHLKTQWQNNGLAAMPQLPTSGHSDLQTFDAFWNSYVPLALLPRLYGYELMMAPYAIAHMKIGLKLHETGYRFGSDERVRVYLTNALEPAADDKQVALEFIIPALAHEAEAVNKVKRHKRFTVVIGNPPYSKISGNLGEYAVDLIKPFRFVNGERIVERGALALELNLQDDYVKFWALLRKALIAADVGIGAYITNSRYLTSPTLRGLRWNLKSLFDRGAFVDLGGQVSERSACVGADENVFDIEQGVAVGICVRRNSHAGMNSVSYGRYRGTRDNKNASLNEATIASLQTTVSLDSPFFRFSHGVDEAESQFSTWHDLSEIMPFNSGCIITSRDNLALDFDRSALIEKVIRFATSPKGDRAIEQEIGYSCKAKWDVEGCKATILNDCNRDIRVRRVLYRPFDERWIYYSTRLLDTPSKPVCDSIYDHDNLVYCIINSFTTVNFFHN